VDLGDDAIDAADGIDSLFGITSNGSIIPDISSAEVAVCLASSLTSLATTASQRRLLPPSGFDGGI